MTGKAPDDILTIACDTGGMVLECGGETYRAEETVEGMLRGWGATEAECFATPTGIFASCVLASGESRCLIRRIRNRSVRLGKLAELHALRTEAEAGGLDPEAAGVRLDVLRDRDGRPWLGVLGAAILAAFFAPLFGGGWREALAASFTGALVKLLLAALSSRGALADFFLNTICGALIPPCAALAASLMPGLSLDAVTIAALMILVPGLAIVNAIRDLMAGDLVAGLARAAEAFMAAAAIALGVGAGLLIPWPGRP